MPPSAVKQSGKTRIAGPILPSWTSRAARSGTLSLKLFHATCARPEPVNPTRSNSTGKRRPRPRPAPASYWGGSQSASLRTCGSPSGLSLSTLEACSSVTTVPGFHRGRFSAMLAYSKKKGRPKAPPVDRSSVSVVVGAELPADLSPRMLVAVHVGVGDPGAHGPDDFRDLPRGDALGRRPNDVSRGDRPRERSRSRCARGPSPSSTEEIADAPGVRLVAQMDMGRRRDRSLQTLVGQLEVDGAVIDDPRLEPAASCAGDCRHFIESLQPRLEVIAMVVVVGPDPGRCTKQRRKGQATQQALTKLPHVHLL